MLEVRIRRLRMAFGATLLLLLGGAMFDLRFSADPAWPVSLLLVAAAVTALAVLGLSRALRSPL
jgi:hypothetical protein